MRLRLLLSALLCAFVLLQSYPQSNPGSSTTLLNFPARFADKISKKAASLENQLDRQTVKYLERLQRKEAKLKRKLGRIDSAAAANVFNADDQYAQLIKKLSSSSTGAQGEAARGEYIPTLDSLKGSLSFLQQNSNLLSGSKDLQGKLGSSLTEVKDLQSRLQQADDIKAFIRQRKEQIKATLSRYTNLPQSITGCFNDYQKELYYYTQQVQQYKDLLRDPDKLEEKAFSLLSKLPAFQQFMKEHSELASLFRIPAGYGTPQALAGLQTRDQVQQLIQNQIGSGPNAQAMLQQNLQNAQGQLSQLKDKVSKLGEGGGDIDMPNFKPNNQRTKTFWQRLEYGTNIQTAHASYFFPTTTDMGLSVGYKLNNNNTIGIGGSYKMGWGKDIQHVSLTSEGASLRSFLDMKLKGSFYVSGGFEYNCQVPAGLSPATTTSGTNQPPLSASGPQGEVWQQSGLVGVSKIISVKTKFFKKTRVQLLWDFLSYEQVPKAQPIRFRVGYNF